MGFLATLDRLFRTATWRRKEMQALASQRFPSSDRLSTLLILNCLVETLGVTVHAFHPHTKLVQDLAADETEPIEISMWLKEDGISISPQQIVDARTVGGLIEAIAKISRDHAD